MFYTEACVTREQDEVLSALTSVQRTYNELHMEIWIVMQQVSFKAPYITYNQLHNKSTVCF